ncbi:hypothetical protein L1887_31584 [Cichorium endivia]|nr:hypothetical protein L1887_31584 [Cichorium endivia]
MGKRERDRPPKVSIFNQDPEFFEIFLPNRISHQLRIPPDFIKHFDQKIPETILLKDLSGKVWHVEVKLEKTGVFLKNGWNRFVNEKSLDLGQFMVFRYSKRSSSFTVRIFGKDACMDEDQDSGKPLTNGVKDEQESHLESTPICKFNRNSRKAPKHRDLASEKGNELDELRSRKRAHEAAKSFKSDNPFYSVTVKASYFNWVYAPVPFMRRYLLNGDEKCVSCVLQVSDGEICGPVMCRDYNTYGKLCGDNWRKFYDENNLGAGDVCVFELINEMKKVLKVTIFRAR